MFGAGDKKSHGKFWAIGELVNSKLHLGEFEPFPCRTALLVSVSFSLRAGHIIRGDSTKLLSKGWRSGCLTSGSREGRWWVGIPESLVPASLGPETLGSALLYLFPERGRGYCPAVQTWKGIWRCDCFINRTYSSSPNFISPQPYFYFQKDTVLPGTLGNSILQTKLVFHMLYCWLRIQLSK